MNGKYLWGWNGIKLKSVDFGDSINKEEHNNGK